MNEENTPLTTNQPARRVSKKALGLLAAAAVSAGAIGSVTLMSSPSAAEPEPSFVPQTIEDVVTNIETDTLEWQDIEQDYVQYDEGNDWDDCPGCGMG